MTLHTFSQFLNDRKLVIFPGAMGTELQRRGYKTTLPLWSATANVDAFDLVQRIHADYLNAGADIAITNTFRTTPRTYAKTNQSRQIAYDALRRSVEASKAAVGAVKDRPTFVAGSFAPLEDCYEPDLVPGDQQLADEHGELAEWLADSGSDLLLPETVNAGREAVAMARAASATGLPFIISFVVNADGSLLDGTSLSDAIALTNLPGREAVMLNCRPIDILVPAFDKLAEVYDGHKGVYPNGLGHPHPDQGWVFEENSDSIQKYVSAALSWKDAGARIIGGCCGTTPAYLQALSKAVV